MTHQVEAEKSQNKCTLSDRNLPFNEYVVLVWEDESVGWEWWLQQCECTY